MEPRNVTVGSSRVAPESWGALGTAKNGYHLPRSTVLSRSGNFLSTSSTSSLTYNSRTSPHCLHTFWFPCKKRRHRRSRTMNCPSRNDDVLMNPGWNQSPPRFAADLTTCEDLNGIANARELGDADRLCSGARGLRHCEVEDNNIKEMEKRPLAVGKGAKGSSKGMCTSRMSTKYPELTRTQDLAPEQPHL